MRHVRRGVKANPVAFNPGHLLCEVSIGLIEPFEAARLDEEGSLEPEWVVRRGYIALYAVRHPSPGPVGTETPL